MERFHWRIHINTLLWDIVLPPHNVEQLPQWRGLDQAVHLKAATNHTLPVDLSKYFSPQQTAQVSPYYECRRNHAGNRDFVQLSSQECGQRQPFSPWNLFHWPLQVSYQHTKVLDTGSEHGPYSLGTWISQRVKGQTSQTKGQWQKTY